MKRDIRIDTLRGFLLVWMTLNHLMGPLSDFTFQALGFISSIEGFVFISGIVAGMVYGRIGLNQGSVSLRKRAFRRALDIYLFHIAAFTFVVILQISVSTEIYASFFKEENSLALQSPLTALVLGALFLWQPMYLDILPMYCLFLLMTPLCINRFMKNQGYWVLLGSFLVWSVATYHFHFWEDEELYLTKYFPCDLGTFNPFAWQFLFVGGLFFGFRRNSGMTIPIKKPLIAIALLLWIGILLIRYEIIPSIVFDFDLLDLTIREVFGPLRVINLLALAYLITCIGMRFPKLLVWPWFSYLGQHSLQVFAFHVVLLYAVLPLYYLIIPLGWTFIILANIAIVLTLTLPAWLHDKYRAVKIKDSLTDT